MGQASQSPEPAQNASFLHKGSALKVVMSDTIDIPVSSLSFGNTTGITIEHNLGYVPMVVASYIYPFQGFQVPLPYLGINYSTGAVTETAFVSVITESEVAFTIGSISSLPSVATVQIKYYLLAEEAA